MHSTGSCRAMGTRKWLPVRGTARRTSSTTIGLWPDSKQTRMSVPSVQVGSLTAKPALTAFPPQSYYSHLEDPEFFVCLQWGQADISLCILHKAQLVFPLVASGKSNGERKWCWGLSVVAWGFFLVLFGGTTVVSCPPHCFFNLQTS